MNGFEADRGQSYGSIESVARALRRILAPDIEPTESLPVLKIFERLTRFSVNVFGREIRLDYAVTSLPTGIEALAHYDRDRDRIVVTLSEATYAGLERGDFRSRFSVCHEIGHAALHAGLIVRLGSTPSHQAAMMRGGHTHHPQYMDTEWQANALAAAFLMPAVGLQSFVQQGTVLTATQIRTTYGVSQDCAALRIQNFRSRSRDLL